MCLGIPGRIAEFDDTNPHLAMVEVTGYGGGSMSGCSRMRTSPSASGF